MMINETRILNEFIELVSVPCPSKDEKAEADLLVQKLQAMGLEVKWTMPAGRSAGQQAMCGHFTGQCRGCSRTVF